MPAQTTASSAAAATAKASELMKATKACMGAAHDPVEGSVSQCDRGTLRFPSFHGADFGCRDGADPQHYQCLVEAGRIAKDKFRNKWLLAG